MARAFGSTYGAGTTDSIQTKSLGILGNKTSSCIWYLLRGAGGNSLGRLFERAGYTILWDDGTSGMSFGRTNSGGTTTANHRYTSTKDAFIWHCLVITHDQTSGTLTAPTIYLDGILTSTVGGGVSIGTDAAGVFTIGNAASGLRNWDGLVAHVTLWNNLLLTQADAEALSRGVPPFLIRPESLLLYLPLYGVGTQEVDLINGMSSAITGTRLAIKPEPVGILGGVPYYNQMIYTSAGIFPSPPVATPSNRFNPIRFASFTNS